MLFGQSEYTVRPNMVDNMSGEPNNFHFIYFNQNVTQKDKLFLFFPGTGAVPFFYKEILKLAANLGYHSIGLTYPNSLAINQICAASTDTTCHSRARLEIFDGIDRHSEISVDTNNCIERRTLKLLQFLSNEYPEENWEQFFSGNEIIWEKIIVSGHSQGGGHAGIISKIKKVERVVMFAATDWIFLLNRTADWVTWEGETSTNRYFGFIHQNDEMVNFNSILNTWEGYGMDSLGELILVDTTSKPYNNAHQLYTLLTPDNDSTKFHGSVVADAYTPFSFDTPVYKPVWTYMIKGSELVSDINLIKKGDNFKVFPNPTNAILNIMYQGLDQANYLMYNFEGKIVKQGVITHNEIDISSLTPSVYLINIQNKSFNKSFKIIKE